MRGYSFLDTLGERLVQQSKVISHWGPDTQACEAIILALRALDDFQQVVLDVDRDEVAKAILKDRHNGLATELQPVIEVLNYGRAVLDLNLPTEISRVLLSDTGTRSANSLSRSSPDVEKAWVPVESFCDFMVLAGA
jgi:hypothetical protein